MRKPLGFFFSLFLLICNEGLGFQSSLFWTTCTTDVVPIGTANLQASNYFTILNRVQHGQTLPPDIGLSFGIFSWNDWEGEIGFDYFGGTDYPWFFNAKVGIEENKLFLNAPSFSIGIYDIGTRERVTDFNIINAVIGKTLPDWLSGGTLYIGVFEGSRSMGKNQVGYMVGYLRNFCQAWDCYGEKYWKWVLVGDYASGKNIIGGGGVGITYYFSPRVNILTGPTFFNDADFNGTWKWAVQINILFSVFSNKKRWD